MLTIYSTFRPFTDELAVNSQLDAVQSWLLLKPKPEILIIGNDSKTKMICNRYGLKHIESEFSKYGTPMLEAMMRNAEKNARNKIMALVSGDIVLFQETMDAVKSLDKSFDMFCGVSIKTDVDPSSYKIDFSNPNWYELAKKKGWHTVATSGDFFVHPKGFLDAMPKMPPFVIGRGMCDSWLLYFSNQNNFLVNITEAVPLYHVPHHHEYWKKNKFGHFPPEENNYTNNPDTDICYNFKISTAKYMMNSKFEIKRRHILMM